MYGNTSSDFDFISNTFQGFFQNLFSTSNHEDFDICISSLQNSITKEMNVSLSRDFFELEVKEAIFSVNSLGSPRLEGFPATFYQQHWDTVGSGVYEAILEVLNHGS